MLSSIIALSLVLALSACRSESAGQKGGPSEKWSRMHEAFVQRSHRGAVDLLFLGDSITEYWLTDGKQVWDREFGRWSTANYGIAGDTTQGVAARIRDGELEGIRPKVLVLLIGTNNISIGLEPPAKIAGNIQKIVGTIRERLPETKILLLGIFPRERLAKARTRAEVSTINAALAGLADGDRVHFLDIGPIFLDANGDLSHLVMPDYLHLSTRGYQLWAEAMRKTLDELMADGR